MNDGVYYMMLHKHKNKIIKKPQNNEVIRIKPCIKNDTSICKTKHVTFKDEWCTFFRFMYN